MKALVLSCGKTKGTSPKPVLELYDGSRWRTVRAALRQVQQQPKVFVFSALHGILPADAVIQPYDLQLEKSGWTSPPKGLELLTDFDVVHLSMGTDYARHLIPKLTVPFEWCGDRGIGDQRAAIWRFILKYDM